VKSLKDKIAVVTGAGSGIGRATAIALANEGCHLAIADIRQEGLEETRDLLVSNRVRCSQHVVDVSNREAMCAFVEEVIAHHGLVNILINNAGISTFGTIEETSFEDFEWLMNINFWGVINGIKLFLPHLRSVDEAHIVNVSSIGGFVSGGRFAPYSASKFAVRAVTEALWQELRDTTIGVSCIFPGGIDTNMDQHARTHENYADRMDQINTKIRARLNKPPSMAASQIVKAIRNERLWTFVGMDARLLYWINKLFPIASNHIAARQMRSL
jgi:NAD(P)-dependent dehydrogenase (short-subunit alcohol dehydrogenase family)